MKQFLFVILIAMLGFVASAEPLTFNDVTGGQNDYITVSMPSYSYSGEVAVGVNQYTVSGLGSFNSFCIDFYDDSTTSQQNYTAVPLASAPQSLFGNVAMGSAAALNIEKLWALKYSSTLDNDYIAAVFQVAIWKAIAEAGGGTVTSSGYDDAANLMLSSAEGYTGQLPSLYAWSNDQYQDYIGIPDNGSTLALAGLGSLSLLMFRRKVQSDDTNS